MAILNSFFRLNGLLQSLAASILIFVSSPIAAEAQPVKIALIIGNSEYEAVTSLSNPVNDAEGIAETLRSLDFEVTIQLDLSYADLVRSLGRFRRQTEAADIALIYYAGHGVEIEGVNYIIPTDVILESPQDIEFEAVRLESAVRAVEGAKKLSIVIVDACRNNPFAKNPGWQGETRSLSRGLSPIEPNGNTLVAYSARDGTVAHDGTGENSPYAEALMQTLSVPGVEIGQLFRRVRDLTLEKTEDQQEPFVYGSLSATEIFLNPPALESEAERLARLELEAWTSTMQNGERSAIEAYLAVYSNGRFANTARQMLAIMDQRLALENLQNAPSAPVDPDLDAWQLASSGGGSAALDQYLKAFPDGQFAETARQMLELMDQQTLLQELQSAPAVPVDSDLDAWTEASADGSISALQKYIAAYPDGKFLNTANSMLTGLRAIEAAANRNALADSPEQSLLQCYLAAGSPFDTEMTMQVPSVLMDEIDHNLATKLCSLANESPANQSAANFMLGRVSESKKLFDEASAFYRLSAHANYTAAKTALGRLALNEGDIEAAILLFEDASAMDDPVALTFLYRIYAGAAGSVYVNNVRAETYLNAAIALGHPHALREGALVLRDGTFGEKDPVAAAKLFEEAARLGDSYAAYEQGMMYWRGVDGFLESDLERGYEKVLAAATAGLPIAQQRVANTLLFGLRDGANQIIAPNLPEAMRWLSQAAMLGSVDAQYRLGDIFYNGSSGVEQDFEEALKWYTMAADQHFSRAVLIVAQMHENAIGIEKDAVRAAEYWYLFTALGGRGEAQNRENWDRETAIELQRLLRNGGYYSGGLDGAIGPGTKRAMQRLEGQILEFQADTYTTDKRFIGVASWECQC